MYTTTRSKAAIAAALFMPALVAWAQAPKISDGIVRIGVLTDLSGNFVDNTGPGSVIASQLAVEDFGGKVLGVPVEIVTGDHQNKADVAVARMREWIDRDKVDVVTELGNSSVALAAMKIAAEKHRMTMVAGAGAMSISNEECTATNVHWVYDTYALTKVGTQSLVGGGAKSWYFVTADYAFGKSLEADGTRFVTAAGGKVLGTSRYPFPGGDFSSYLLTAQASGAQAIGLATAGADLQNAIKQGIEFGLGKDQKLAPMLMSIVDVNSLGLKTAQGMQFAESFYWDRDDASRKFARRFFDKAKRMPTALQAGQYSAVLSYLKAVQQARSDDVTDVMKAIKSMPIDDAFARNGHVRQDGKMVHDMYLVEVKKPSESKTPWDYYRIVKTVAGNDSFAPISESKCKLAR